MKLARRPSLGVALGVGCCAIAAAVFLNHLGSSGLFSDENYSWHAAAGSLGDVFSRDRATENTPPLYYLLLHVWIGVFGSGTVWGMRLLSVLAAIAAVGGTAWLGSQVAGAGGALAAGLAAAVSPLLLQYAQEIRAYAPVMAAVALAAAGAVQAARGGTHPNRWLALATVMSVATVWLHYSGILVALVIGLYIWTTPTLGRRARAIHVGIVAAALVIVAPLMVLQLSSGHQGGIAPYAKFTATNLLLVIGTPFDGRFNPQALTDLTGAGAIALTMAAVGRALALARRQPAQRELRLVTGAAVTPVAALVLINVVVWLTGESSYASLTTRYTAVAAPFMLVAIGWVLARGPRLLRPAVLILVGVACVSGLVGDYSRNTRWPDFGQAFAYVQRSLRPGDAVLLDGYPAEAENAAYYVSQFERHTRVPVRSGLAQLKGLSASRVFLLIDPGTAASVGPALAAEGWNSSAEVYFTPDAEVMNLIPAPGVS